MATAVEFTNVVCGDGYVWIAAADWNLMDGRRWRQLGDGEPTWRVREPWNARGTETPRILLSAPGRSMINHKFHSLSPTTQDPALYRNFAAMEPSEQRIVEFANRYGLLWDSMVGIPFAEWEYEVRTMRSVIEIWDAASEKRTAELSKHFRPDKNGKHLTYPFSGSLARHSRYHAPKPHSVGMAIADHAVGGAVGSVVKVARGMVYDSINAHLVSLGPRVELAPVNGNQRLTLRADSLLGAMWLQFAVAVGAESRYRQCEVCGQYMEISPDVNRTDRRYCDNACRNKAARQRQKAVREMRAEGKSLREIAKAVGSDVATIKKWLAA